MQRTVQETTYIKKTYETWITGAELIDLIKSTYNIPDNAIFAMDITNSYEHRDQVRLHTKSNVHASWEETQTLKVDIDAR